MCTRLLELAPDNAKQGLSYQELELSGNRIPADTTYCMYSQEELTQFVKHDSNLKKLRH